MNTPAHVVFNLLVFSGWKRQRAAEWLVPVSLGALTPDAPMVLFYFWEKVIRSTPERVIWSERYFDGSWQTFFDLFNSLPIIALAAGLAFWRGMPKLGVFFLSMALHCLTDLPLHNDDAHRHFLPFSNWRFESPLSYWDPRHSGTYIALAEVAMVLGGSVFLAWRHRQKWIRAALGTVFASYLLYLVYVFVAWV